MLKKSRPEVLESVRFSIKNQLNGWQKGYNSPHLDMHYLDDEYRQAPAHSQAWPPGLADYIERVATAAALAIVDALYTEQELEAKFNTEAEKQLLGPTNS